MKTIMWMKRGCLCSRSAALLVLPLACSSAKGAPNPQLPPEQVWITPSEAAEQKIEVTTVAEQVIDDTLWTSGTIVLDDLRSAHVFSPVTGRVTKIMAQFGQRVKKGDSLATIESPDIGQAVSDVHKAEADLVAAEHDLQRKKDLLAMNAAAVADVEASEDTERRAVAELERARQKQFLLRVGNVDAVSQTYTIPSPIDGEVLLRNLSPGMEVQGQYSGGANNICLPGLTTNAACGELFTIGEIDKVWVFGDVYESDLERVHLGAKASVTTVAFPKDVFVGKVDWVSGGLDPNTRTAKVRCTFDNPQGKLRPMMYAKVAISIDAGRALAVPRSAIVRLGDAKVVFLQIGSTDDKLHFERRPVDLAETRGTGYVEVTRGLEAGHKVVISGGSYLSQKML